MAMLSESTSYRLLRENEDPKWMVEKIEGSWFPDAFIGSMASLMCYLEGSTNSLQTSVEDVVNTMAIVEAVYESSASGGTTPTYIQS